MTTARMMPLAVGLFAIGVVALVAMFAVGSPGLPGWVFALGLLCSPAGLALGVITVVRDSRRPRTRQG
ncbi:MULTISPECIES: hypothetical protein [Actinosynnema]|uniref:Integral membrane protein n=1 Tax=Actinosynnema pretiosum TaxID=42197 RepID=A0A290YZX3_9PSEU|nr:hypothetical protein [Actinosynnema pretiosum]ATE52297.1 hypothetical protein CNX65_02445 [Actinosynnema pretiosum]